jgi:dCTP deaminase
MQLSGPEILKQMRLNNPHNPGKDGRPNIIIEPFDERCLGSNSYDLHLSPVFKVYKDTIPDGMKPYIVYNPRQKYSMRSWFYKSAQDAFLKYKNGDPEYDFRNPKFLINPIKEKETIEFEIPETGAILNPMFGYLASTVEYTETYNLFPYIDGKSSLGRNFILNHHTAGRGDDGFCGNWTLEIRVLHPTVVFPYMRIGQIYYDEFRGEQRQYNQNPSSHYNNQHGPTPAAPVPVDLFIKELAEKQKTK